MTADYMANIVEAISMMMNTSKICCIFIDNKCMMCVFLAEGSFTEDALERGLFLDPGAS